MDSLTRLIQWLFTPLVIIGAIVFAVILFGLTLAAVAVTRPERSLLAPSTAVLTVIAAPTATPLPPTPTTGAPPTPTLPVPPAPPAGVLAVGAYVQISGTGGDGLRLRTNPGLLGEVRLLGGEAEVFVVQEGPQEVDGYTWWYLVAPYDETRRGWAVSNYLAVVQNP